VVISAPAGFGKTTFISQWLRSIPGSYRVGWYSVDEKDNTLPRFFSYIVAALRNADPLIGTGFMEEVEAHPELRADELIAYTINQVAESLNNILLIIDDVHFINSSEIHKVLETLIEHLPSNLILFRLARGWGTAIQSVRSR
jgi:LuxR family maltose regulon positive regulatory protein